MTRQRLSAGVIRPAWRIAAGLCNVARHVAQVARAAGVTRDALYKALTKDRDARLSTVRGVTRALGLKIQVAG